MDGERRAPRDVDWILIAASIALCLIGVAFIQSAKMAEGAGLASEAKRQLGALVLALFLVGVILRFDYRKLLALAPVAYGIGIVGLLALIPFGVDIGGNKAWLRLGGISLQPSEPMKAATVLMLASMATRRESRLLLPDFLLQVVIVGVPMMLVKLGDTGTALTFVPLLLASIFVSGLSWRWIAAGAVLLALCAPLGWKVLPAYQKKRVEIVLHPELEPSGKGYHQLQSRIAVGSGGFLGQGYEKGPQNRLGFLPERHTDFIFAVVAEEWGFLGAALVLALYLIVLKRLADAAILARDRQGAVLCVGIMVFVGVHLAVNVGMVIGLMPTIGIPLPLMSFGGSSIIAFLMMIGLALNVRMHRLAR